MKANISVVLSVLVGLLANAAKTDAFSVGGRHSPLPQKAAKVGGRKWSQHTKVFVSEIPGVGSKRSSTVDEGVGEQDPIEYISQEGNANMNPNSMVAAGIFAVAGLAVLYQAATVDPGLVTDLQATAIKIPTELWASYSEVLDAAPVQTKAVTSATVYTIGDCISQRTEGVLTVDELDKPRVVRSLLAGLLGHGPLSHLWYEFSENLFQNVLHLPNDAFGTAAKVVIDQTSWGPFWNNTYILLLGLMKFDSFETIFSEMKRTTIPLIVSGLKLWPLAHCVTYGLVPVQNRLLWVDVVEIAWVTILSTTAAGKEQQADTKQ